MVRSNAEATAGLLAAVAPGAIVSNDFMTLISYIKAVTANPEVVFATFFAENGRPLTRYLDRKNPEVRSLLKTEGKDPIQRVMKGAASDRQFYTIEAPMELNGQAMGKVVICLTRRPIDELTQRMSDSFSKLTDMEREELQKLVGRAGDLSRSTADRVSSVTAGLLAENTRANEVLLKDVEGIYREVQGNMKRAAVVGGTLCLALVALVVFFNTLSIGRRLHRMIQGVSGGADEVSKASDYVSSAGRELADSASQQAASIEEASSSLEQMASMTRRNAENATQANDLMAETSRVMGEANESMNALTRSMGEISQASTETQKIVKSIDEIAFQTNLLALNAAVEAARAGEAGAGFAVVADEVRNLALRAAEAAKNTGELIEGSAKKIAQGSEVLEQTSGRFSRVASSAEKAAGLVSEITEASQEQAQGLEQVNRAVADMDKVVQQNAASAEESAASAGQMNDAARLMRNYVADLKAMVDGSRANGGRELVHRENRGEASSFADLGRSSGKRTSLPRNGGRHGQRPRSGEVSPERILPLEETEHDDF
jgi:methyl-accepting chemotaxis protein